MALFNINYGSETMNKYMGMTVILPDGMEGLKDGEGKYSVLFLLHGYTGDHTKWLRMSSVEWYANDLGMAVVMPDAAKSFYVDMAHGDPYFTYLTEEVPAYVRKWLPITKDPAYTFIAGLSMGGYGAMKTAMTYPDRYRAAATFSGSLAMAQLLQADIPEGAEDWIKRLGDDLPLAFGYDTDITGTPHDLFWLAEQMKSCGGIMPHLYVSCGTDDFVYDQTLAFKACLTALKIPCTYHEEPGVHEFGLWDREVYKFMGLCRELMSQTNKPNQNPNTTR